MLVLALETATRVAGVALISEGKVQKEIFLHYRQTHSQTLMVMVDEVLKECEVGLNQIDAVAVSIGPGSFTGLRIGLATAKGLAMGSGKPIVGIPTLDALAYNACLFRGTVCPVLDARKDEVYTAFYKSDGSCMELVDRYRVCSPRALVDDVRTRATDGVVFLGDGAVRYREFLQQTLGDVAVWVPGNLAFPRASSVGLLAWHKLRGGGIDDARSIVPVYIRLSEAETRLGLGAM
ncbi:MAG TPA: tRNA (adenosine(37)-N6)-threonylcarbamoyltransferase complex dimerization subunit type 1 TsaB [Syntrophothermus lipocalidus]|uniref:Peptidase M22 glycoprotease n=1 Tax=Syntrophothermus lipocalidus (strain DSM 12680 / TGB-C1) TaxID=643648 RepID=D7CKV8_SYNLT|nr:peptidase M22 glycoprotease [Syntrophothermus lipocalidus DSM 12680]HHV77395.1 tRNA (adenosine(37)-N6)-threonylcarbamoyltransferase complex dimerization subunit type 1 TsaB [Syntrophothermus lipocalidus]